jgi:HSP20 family molecular chaperone IbpA
MYKDLDLFNVFDDFFKDFLRFDKDVFRFNSPVSRVYERYMLDENTVLLTLNLLGIRPEDIEVTIKSEHNGIQKLMVSATTVNSVINKTYNYDNVFTVGSNLREVDSFEWESKDGILYIVMKYKKMAEPKTIESNRKVGLLENLKVPNNKEEK